MNEVGEVSVDAIEQNSGNSVKNEDYGKQLNNDRSNQELSNLGTKVTERKMVIGNPGKVGINFDQDLIVDARSFWSHDRYVKYVEDRDGEISGDIQPLIDSGQSQRLLKEKRESELRKKDEQIKYLTSFEGKIKHLRVHPAGEFSPITPSQAIEIGSDGTYKVEISPGFVDQIKAIQKQVSDLTLVVQFYDHRRGKDHASDVPETELQVEQYVALCDGVVDHFGDGIQLEIGNETNVSRNTGQVFADKLQHASHVDSTEYADFYFKVAQQLKERHPDVKLSIAGVACFDPTYLTEVLTKVEDNKKKSGVNTKLIDIISFHPYRDEPEKGSVEVKNGNFLESNLDYEDQLAKMQSIAVKYSVDLTVGEINFSKSDPEQQVKLQQSNEITSKRGVVSFIYPGNNVE
jgi:hypothetical protein